MPVVEDPDYERLYDTWAAQRRACPVAYEAEADQFVLTAAGDVATVLRSGDMLKDPRRATAGTALTRGVLKSRPSMLQLDPPEHTRLRALVSRAFTPKAIERLTPTILALAQQLLSLLRDEPTFDVITRFADPLATRAIAELMGIDAQDWEQFKRWSADLTLQFVPDLSPRASQRLFKSVALLHGYFRDAIAARRAAPRDDLITSLLHAQESDDRLSDEEIITMCVLLLAAGNLTTTDLIGNGVLAMLQNPSELEQLRADPALLPRVVEEVLRYDSPVTLARRVCARDTVIGGVGIAQGASLNVMLSAANHDPDVHAEPARFDISRASIEHHSFGGGVHYCLGASLARLVGKHALAAIFEQFPTLHLVEGAPLARSARPGFSGLDRLMVAP